MDKVGEFVYYDVIYELFFYLDKFSVKGDAA
jgi:hypothetical protein